MNKVTRSPLPAKIQKYLATKTAGVRERILLPNFVVKNVWENARKTQRMCFVFQRLQNMTNPKGKCMYCMASLASDIEHFWPKTAYPRYAFKWENLLLCCTECGRYKNDYFPIDVSILSPLIDVSIKCPWDLLEFEHSIDLPLLINPTTENPWNFLEFNPETGNIMAKFDVSANAIYSKGVETVNLLQLGKREALSKSYIRSYKRICNVVNDYLTAQTTHVELVSNLRLADENGLLEWCIHFNGRKLAPFSNLKGQFPDVWQTLEDTIVLSLSQSEENRSEENAKK